MKFNDIYKACLLITAALCCMSTQSQANVRYEVIKPSTPKGIPVHKVTVHSRPFEVKKIYRSMEGPSETQSIKLWNGPTSELLWLRSIKTMLVQPDSIKEPAQALPKHTEQFMCHVNVDFQQARLHTELFNTRRYTNPRVVTLSQGQLNMQLPDGFGMPLLSSEALSLNMQVLNLNYKNADFQVQHRVEIEFIRDVDLVKRGLKINALFTGSAYGLALVEGNDGYYRVPNPDKAKHGESCLPGERAPNGGRTIGDTKGQRFTGHWVVPPGRQINHTNITHLLNLPFDTDLHYAAVHLHPFAESLTLKDLTTGKVVFKSKATNTQKGMGLTRVEYFSSKKGVRLHKGHEYQLISVYNNRTQENHDSMAVMYMYFNDPNFKKPI